MEALMYILNSIILTVSFATMITNLCFSNFGIAWLWLIGVLYTLGNLIAIDIK